MCSSCHTEIGERVEAGLGYHGRVVDSKQDQRDCAACHREHIGREFQLVYWPQGEAAFNHAETGFELTGKHSDLKCRACHAVPHIDLNVLRRSQVKEPNRTFLGLVTRCSRCHEDPHRNQVGGDCARCHVTESFADVSKFDHQQTDFALTGRHASVDCANCHVKESDGFVPFHPFQSTACRTCHEDPHGGAFAQSCEACHSTANWLPRGLSKNFDHTKTDFPLLGKHQGLSCNQCHAGARFGEPIAHGQCLDCHREDDPHEGQFKTRPNHGECADCHNADGFKPTTFSREMHQKTEYLLLGKHLAVECEGCHLPEGPKTVFKITAVACQDCHKDVHEDQFGKPPYDGACKDCHSVDGFHPSTFTLTRHQDSSFPLAGAHVAVSCSSCHEPEPRPSGKDVIRFHFAGQACTVCHDNPHGGQFEPGAVAAVKRDCETCHQVSRWDELLQFDHATTEFPLEGAHRTVACQSCHADPDDVTSIRGVRFDEAPDTCSGCHFDSHDGQFETGSRTRPCSSCHTVANWQPTQFNHDEFSGFTLDGAHREVPCRMCHTEVRQVDGTDVAVYRGTLQECSACHK